MHTSKPTLSHRPQSTVLATAGQGARPVVLVTDADRPEGSSIARRISATGATVLLHYRENNAAVGRLLQDIVAADGRALAFQSTVEDADALRRAVSAATTMSGPVDAMILLGHSEGTARPLAVESWHQLADEASGPIKEALIWSRVAQEVLGSKGAGRIVAVWTGNHRRGLSPRMGHAGWETLLHEVSRELEGLGIDTYILHAATYDHRAERPSPRQQSLADAVLGCLRDRGRASALHAAPTPA